jgi:hypothetical protein
MLATFHQVVPNQVLKTMDVMRHVCRSFEAFDDPDWNLAQFIKSRFFHKCNQFLVQWLDDIEPYA